MPQANILNSAVADLAEIWAYIALDSPDNADHFIDRIFRICQEGLASNPHLGLKPKIKPSTKKPLKKEKKTLKKSVKKTPSKKK